MGRISKACVYDHATRKQPPLPCIREVTRFRRVDIEKFIEEHCSFIIVAASRPIMLNWSLSDLHCSQ
jgi:hypothetical protein